MSVFVTKRGLAARQSASRSTISLFVLFALTGRNCAPESQKPKRSMSPCGLSGATVVFSSGITVIVSLAGPVPDQPRTVMAPRWAIGAIHRRRDRDPSAPSRCSPRPDRPCSAGAADERRQDRQHFIASTYRRVPARRSPSPAGTPVVLGSAGRNAVHEALGALGRCLSPRAVPAGAGHPGTLAGRSATARAEAVPEGERDPVKG